MYVDERSRDSLRDEPRYGGREGTELEEGGRYHERLSGGSSRLLTVREDSRHGGGGVGDRRGSREIMYERERSGHHRESLKPIRSSSVRVGGERGGGYSLLRDDRRPSLKGSRSSPRRPIEPSDRARPSRREIPSSSHHYSHSVEREHRKERHHKAREERRERHRKGHHHRNRREGAGEERESSTVASTVETMITISSESGGEEERERERGRVEKIEDLIRDIESGSSSGEISEGESEGEGGASPGSKEDDSSSEKENSSDGKLRIQSSTVCSSIRCGNSEKESKPLNKATMPT